MDDNATVSVTFSSAAGVMDTTTLTWSGNNTMYTQDMTTINSSVLNGTKQDMTNITDTINSKDIMSTSMIMTIVYITFGVFGMISNGFVVFVLISSPKLRKSITNIYIIHQSILDMLISVLVIALSELNLNDIKYSGLAGELYCRMWLTKLPLWWFMLASTYNLMTLTLERYLNVIHPIWHKVHFSHRMAYGTIAFIVIESFVHQCISLIPTSGVVNGHCLIVYNWPSPMAQRVYGISVVVLRFFIPLVVFIYTYSRIAGVMYKKVKQREAQSSQGATNEMWTRGMKNAIKTMAMVSLAYVMCMAFNQIYFFMINIGFPADYTSDFYHLSAALVYLNSTINPFIYTANYEQFKLAAKKKFCGRCMSAGGTNSIANSSTQEAMNGSA